jgi:predicted ABC-type ATPase
MPDLFLFGGPNGAGKTTTALRVLRDFGCGEFVNADAIAAALSPFHSEAVDWKAGVLMMRRLRELAASGVDFATKSTLAARAYVPFIRDCQARGYRFNLIYLWLPSANMAVEHVAARVRAGDHHISEATIRRRYEAGRANFLELY